MPRFIPLLIAILFLASPALADECTSPVFDMTGKVNISEIEPVLRKIVGDGADPAMVRIITTNEMNRQGNLDKYAGNLLGRCSSWQSAGGRLKTNIFLLILEPNGKVAVQFAKKGPFQNILTHEKIVDISQEMGGLIAKGDLTGAAKAGLLRAHTLISTTAVQPSTPAPLTIVNHNEKPTDFSGFFSFLKWLLLVGVLGGAVWLVMLWYAGKAKCRAAQQKAQNAKGNCTSLIEGFATQLNTLNALMGSLKATLSTTEFGAFLAKLNGIQARMDSMKNQFVNQSGSANDPEATGLSVESYNVMADSYERLHSNLEEISSDANRLERSIREMARAHEWAHKAIKELTQQIESVTTNLNEESTLKTEGPRATLKKAIDLLEQAEDYLTEKSFQAVLNTCQEGRKLTGQAVHELKGLAARKKAVDHAIRLLGTVDVSEILPNVDALIRATRQVRGDGAVSDAAKIRAGIVSKISERRIAVAAAKSAATAQNWEEAERQIEIARKADAFLDYEISRIEDEGPAIIRKPQTVQQETVRRSSHSKPSVHTHSHPVHVVNVIREESDLGFGAGAVLGGLSGLAVGASLDREERRNWSRTEDKDNSFGGESVQTCQNSSDSDTSGFGGESVQSTSTDDSGFSSNNND